jgi:lysozyme family protein
MSSFEEALPVLLQHEGGLVDHKADPGGITNFGVSLRFLADYPEVGDFDGDGDVDAEDIRNMTAADAAEIYRKFWWDKYNYGEINDQTIATKIFDMSVNMGASRAHKIVQTALNKAFGLQLTVDGIIGRATRGVINACEDDTEQHLLTAICDEQFGFYTRLIANKPALKVFERGWKNRAYSLGKANAL